MSKISYLIDRLVIKQPRFRSAITRLIYGNRDLSVDLFGTNFIINSIRENGYFRAFKKSLTSSLFRDEASVLISLSSILQPGDTFIDVGANIGLFSCVLSRRNSLARNLPTLFYAYEPHPNTFERLRLNSAPLGIVCRNVAVSNKRGEEEFIDGAVSHVFTNVASASQYNIQTQRQHIKTVRLDEEKIEGNSIVIKIDVEGSELAVLQGATKLFESNRVKAVYLDGFKNEVEVESFLQRFNFAFFNGRTLERSKNHEFSLLAICKNG